MRRFLLIVFVISSFFSMHSFAGGLDYRIIRLLDSAIVNIDKNPKRALEFVEDALNIGDKSNELTSHLPICYSILGDLNYNQKNWKLSAINYQKAIIYFTDDQKMKRISSNRILKRINYQLDAYLLTKKLGNAYFENGNYDESLENYFIFQEKAKNRKDTNDIVYAKKHIAALYSQQNKNNLALKYYLLVLDIEKERLNNVGIIEANNNIGQAYMKLNNNSLAMVYFNAAKSLAESINDDESMNTSLENLSQLYTEKKDYVNAIETRKQKIAYHSKIKEKKQKRNNKGERLTEETIEEYDEETSYKKEEEKSFESTDQTSDTISLEYSQSVAQENLEIGNIYLEQDKEDEAITYLENSLKLSSQSGDLENQGVVLEALSKAYDKSGEYERALVVYKQYMSLLDTLKKQRKTELASNNDLSESLNSQQERINLLERERELNDKTINILKHEQQVISESMQAQLIIIYSLFGVLIIVIIASSLVYRSSKQKRRANQLLALKSLRSQMNPHFIFNSLNSVNSFISKSDERSANKYLSEFSRLMRQVMENSSHDFVSLSSEIEILRLYLKLEHFRFNDKFDYEFSIDDDLEIESYNIPPMLIQPYIENAVWHGLRYKEDKGFLKVTISEDDDHLITIIEDDGIGRKKSQELKTKYQKENVSTGLKNIENRVKIINEIHKTRMKVNIEDLNKEAQTGTVVKITIFKQKEN